MGRIEDGTVKQHIHHDAVAAFAKEGLQSTPQGPLERLHIAVWVRSIQPGNGGIGFMLGRAGMMACRALEAVAEQVRRLVRGRSLEQTPNDKVDNLCLLSTVAMQETIVGMGSLARRATYLGLQ